MNKKNTLLIALLALSAASCSPRCCYDPCNEVLHETYVHKYGVEVAPQDWSARGQCGQVTSVSKDGTTTTRQYDNGILHGDCTYTFPHSSAVARRDNYHQGALLTQTHYYPSGGAHTEIKPISDARRQVTTWYESGEPKSVEEHEGPTLLSGEYYTTDHSIEARVDDGNGTRVNRDPYGQLVSREQFENGVPHKVTTFHANGSPKDVVPLQNGTAHGSIQSYMPDGEPAKITQLHQGVPHGVTAVYQNGEVVATLPYNNGVLDGVEERYKDGHVLATQITWVAGQRQGPTHHYAGGNVTTDWYYRDQLVSKNDYEILMNKERRFN